MGILATVEACWDLFLNPFFAHSCLQESEVPIQNCLEAHFKVDNEPVVPEGFEVRLGSKGAPILTHTPGTVGVDVLGLPAANLQQWAMHDLVTNGNPGSATLSMREETLEPER